MSPISKKRKLKEEEATDSSNEEDRETSDSEMASAEESDSEAKSSSIDTDTEIALARQSKSKKTAKRKRRAVSPTPFGQTLTALLETTTATSQPLALRPSIAKKHDDEKLEMRARKILRDERRQTEEKGRVKDVIGGWGGENERTLRKVAQRGVVKLFNMVQQVQGANPKEDDEPKRKGFYKRRNASEKSAEKDESREDKVQLDQDDFMKMIRSGIAVLKD